MMIQQSLIWVTPEITAKMGSSYSSLGDGRFPTSIDNTNGMNIVESSYTATAGEVTRTYETATTRTLMTK